MKRLLCLLLLLCLLPLCAIADETHAAALIVYFSMPEDVELNGADAMSGASVLVNNGVRYGNVEYVAALLAKATGADLWRIETEQAYPLEHGALLDFAAEEQSANARPALLGKIENLAQYDRIFLGFPNWWYDLPMPLYTFLESYDLSGKEIIPFTVHGGSGFSSNLDSIAQLQPQALVSEYALSISRNQAVNCAEQVSQWLAELDEGGIHP